MTKGHEDAMLFTVYVTLTPDVHLSILFTRNLQHISRFHVLDRMKTLHGIIEFLTTEVSHLP